MTFKRISLVLCICFGLNLFSQNKDSIALNNFKRYLKYNLKSKQVNSSKIINNRVGGTFIKPWNLEKIDALKAKEILKLFIKNAELYTELDPRNNLKLVYSSNLNNLKTENLDNLNIKITDYKILDSNENSIVSNKKKYKYNESRKLTFSKPKLITSFPIENFENEISGVINFTINEFQEFSFVKNNIKNPKTVFRLREHTIRLIKIENNKAYFEFPKEKIDNLEIVATNNNNEFYTFKMLTSLPKKVYYFKESEESANNDKVNKFISSLTYKDIFESSSIVQFTTNGIFENLYLYIKYSNKELDKKTYKISFKK